MSLRLIRDVRNAFKHLNPDEVRREAAREIKVGVIASDNGYSEIETFLLTARPPGSRHPEPLQVLHRLEQPKREKFDLVLVEQGLPCPRDGFFFYREDPARTVEEVLSERPDIEIPLARRFYSFRMAAINRIVKRVSRENGLFTLATALPNIVPNFLELPWAVGEFASDTAFLTINQVRMAFLIAAANHKPIGYAEQKAELLPIVGGAFGWRALAREVVGKIPLGGGLLPKAAISFAGTYLVGKGLQKYHELGTKMDQAEKRATYKNGYEQGRKVLEPSVKEAAQQAHPGTA